MPKATEKSVAREANVDETFVEPMLSSSDVRAWLGVSRDTLLRLRRDHNFPSGMRVLPGASLKFSRSAVGRWIAERQARFASLRSEPAASTNSTERA